MDFYDYFVNQVDQTHIIATGATVAAGLVSDAIV